MSETLKSVIMRRAIAAYTLYGTLVLKPVQHATKFFPARNVKMVNWWPLQYVGLTRTNNKYRAVRTAAQNYATALNAMNKAGSNQNALRAAKENHNKKKNLLNGAILEYLKPTSGGVPPAAGPGFFNRFKRGAAPPPAAGPAPTPNANWPNGTAKNVPVKIGGPGTATEIKRVYRQGANYFTNVGNNAYRKVILKTGPLGRFGRAGNRYYGYNYSPNAGVWGKGANNKFVLKANANAGPGPGPGPSGVNRIAFGKFMMLAPTLGSNTVNKQAKNYLNGNNRYKNNFGPVNFNAVRRVTKNTNTNAATRSDFWAAVNAEMARRGAPPPFKNLAAFKTYYATNAMRMQPTNQARAHRYLRDFNAANNAGKRVMGGAITKNNNNNANRRKNGGFWNAVGDELRLRPTA
jgi:hypothetical protein